jgi:membrane-bound ClpP family serine protease
VREWILAAVSQPPVAAAAFALGWAGIVAEFLFPGKVLPGALGGVLAVLGLWALLPDHIGLAFAVTVPCSAVTVVLLAIAARAHRNKTTV